LRWSADLSGAAGDSPVEGRRRRLRSPLVMPEGVEAGLLGALTVAAVFLVRDLWIGEPPLHTPSLLGTLLMSGGLAARTQGPVTGAAALYHTFHFLAWVALGFAGSALMAHAERTRARWVPPLAAILALVPLAVLDVYVRLARLERMHLWLGGLAGIVAMGAFLAWRHPGALRREAGEI
jgi:hypothetical protein